MSELSHAEQLALEQLQDEFPAHEVTVNQFGVAELRPLRPEELAKKERALAMAKRAEVLDVFGNAA